MGITLEPLPFGNDYSMKNIPTASEKEHQCKLIIKGSNFINHLLKVENMASYEKGRKNE